MRKKVLFVGNCQAQAFQSLSGHLQLEIDVSPMPPVWRVTDADSEDLGKQLENADFIFSQRLSEDFPARFLRNSELKTKYGKKVIVWPNIYFDGYFPGLKYIYGIAGKLEGPLLDYHFDWIHRGWQEKLPIEEVILTTQVEKKWQLGKDFVELSLLELRRREKQVDVRISDYIVENFRSKKLFYSMNHPETSVLVEMMRRLFAFSNIPFRESNYQTYAYHLNQIEIPEFEIFRNRYHPLFQIGNILKGVGIDEDAGKPTDEVVYYTWDKIVDTYYRLYDRHLTR